MTLQQLEYIVAVARYQHFAKAADHCDVTQPTLSSMVQKLEDELGIKIFDRKRQPIRPTKAGQAIVDHAWEVLLRARDLREAAQEAKLSLEGTFNIGVLPTVAPYLVPRFFPQLMNEHPEMDIRITEMKTDDMRLALQHGDLDAGILARVAGLDDMECRTLFYEQFYAYVAEGDPLSHRSSIKTADLSGEYLWLLDEGHCFRDQLVRFCDLKSASRSKRSYNLGSIETFMRIVESGKGVTFIPQLATLQLTEGQRRLVKPFALPIPTREIVLMTAPGFIRTTFLQMLSDRIRAAVPKEMHTLHKTQMSL